MSSNISIQKTCLFCNANFTAKTTVTKYCGQLCASRSYKKRKRQEKLQNAQNDIVPLAINEVKIERDLLSIKEACSLLGIGRTTLYHAIKRKQIKTLSIGRRVLIHRDHIYKLFK